MEALRSKEAKKWFDDNKIQFLGLTLRWLSRRDEPVSAWLLQVLVWEATSGEAVPPQHDKLLVMSFPITSSSGKLSDPLYVSFSRRPPD